jgi:hypothetical protein
MFLDRLRRQIRRGQIFREWTEQGEQLLSGWQIFSDPIHERANHWDPGW